jgi:uncharacterized membrane protein YidH (DUF202 family)
LTVREVVLHRDIRAFADFSATTPLNRHHLRRFLSVFALVGIDVAAIALAALLMVALTRTIRPAHPYPGVLTLTGVCLVVVFVFLANGLYGRRFMRQSARRLARLAHGARGGRDGGAGAGFLARLSLHRIVVDRRRPLDPGQNGQRSLRVARHVLTDTTRRPCARRSHQASMPSEHNKSDRKER